ncbi:MAG: hypothetical protein PHQ89_01715 [Bacilli bacterium]|nr:hypothetical protein [Bacilli bacterium]
MLEITKKLAEHGYYFIITTEEGSFEISYEGNLDLYWANKYSGSILDQPASKSFTITKENYYLYTLFNELYQNVKKCNVFTLEEIDIAFCADKEEINEKRLEKEKLNQRLKKGEEYNQERLFQNEVIEWRCDDFSYEEASILKIKKENNAFIVIFEKSKQKQTDVKATYSVRISNSGSRYNPFNILFMKMYNSLLNYEPKTHEPHIEENSN